MAYCNKCPLCGAYLDPGERCDCKEEGKYETSKLSIEEKKHSEFKAS